MSPGRAWCFDALLFKFPCFASIDDHLARVPGKEEFLSPPSSAGAGWRGHLCHPCGANLRSGYCGACCLLSDAAELKSKPLKVKNKNRILNRKAKWRNQNVKNENGKVKNKNRNLNRKAKWRSENQKVKNKNEITIWPPWASVDIRTEVAGNRGHVSLYRRNACDLTQVQLRRHAACRRVKTCDVTWGFLVADGLMSSYAGVISQAVPAAMSQIVRWHMRTRLCMAWPCSLPRLSRSLPIT